MSITNPARAPAKAKAPGLLATATLPVNRVGLAVLVLLGALVVVREGDDDGDEGAGEGVVAVTAVVGTGVEVTTTAVVGTGVEVTTTAVVGTGVEVTTTMVVGFGVEVTTTMVVATEVGAITVVCIMGVEAMTVVMRVTGGGVV